MIDCGLSAKQTEIRLGELGLRPDAIDAILITHEHSDHIHGVPTLSKKYRIPVYANEQTAKHLRKGFGFEKFKTGADFWVGAVRINPFSIVHDAVDPVGFALHSEGLKFIQLTDLGRVTPIVAEVVRDANAMVLESNHDGEMLQSCGYPWELKQRIASSHGHLSNDTAGTLLYEVMHPGLFHVVLGHLSENSNTPELALSTVKARIGPDYRFSLRCGSVRSSTPIMNVDEGTPAALVA